LVLIFFSGKIVHEIHQGMRKMKIKTKANLNSNFHINIGNDGEIFGGLKSYPIELILFSTV
jgi:hypothetical protein